MKRLFKALNKKLMKQDARQLGINLVTASIVGGFITHTTKITSLTIIMIIWVGIVGFIWILFGLHKADN